MADNPLTLEKMLRGSQNLDVWETATSGDENTDWTNLVGDKGPSLKKAIKTIMQKAPINSTPFASKAALFAETTLANGSFAFVHDDGAIENNGLYQKVAGSWVYQKFNPLNFLTSALAGRQQAYEAIKQYINPPITFNNLTAVEKCVFDFVKALNLRGFITKDIALAIVYKNNHLDSFTISDGYSIIDLLTTSNNVSVVKDNGLLKTIAFHFNNSLDKTFLTGEIVLDCSQKEYSDFIYNPSDSHPNLKFKADKLDSTNSLLSLGVTNKQLGLYNLISNGNGVLLTNSVYMQFTVDSPFILGCVSVDVVNIPNFQPAWVECCIYPQDNGFGTAQRITSSDQIPITAMGTMRLPLENKVLRKGVYTIGFKTNAPNALAINLCGGMFVRGYDVSNKPMPATAPNIYIMDKTGFFPAYSLHEYQPTVHPILPPNWALEYHPEKTVIYGTTSSIFAIHAEGLAGNKQIYFCKSDDGGSTYSKIGVNINEQDYALFAQTMHGVVRWIGSTLEAYLAQSDGRIIKAVVTDNANSFTDITPIANTSKNDLHSYAALVIWKGYLWWGEYGNPEAPKVHKMDLDTGAWSVSLERPTSGKTGARHVHYLYASPLDKNVLWVNYGDASNGGGNGLSKLTITADKASANADNWVQWSTGVHDDNGTTLPYPTAFLELYEPAGSAIGNNETMIVGAGDQPPTHLIAMRTKPELAGKALTYPLNFKREDAPKTETCHWIIIDDEKTIYYFTVESNPQMSLYASPYPYTETFQIAKYWQQALAGAIYYSNGYICSRNYRFPKIKFRNVLSRDDISKIPYVANATNETLLDKFNELLANMRGSGLLQNYAEQGNDKSASNWTDVNAKWENWGQN